MIDENTSSTTTTTMSTSTTTSTTAIGDPLRKRKDPKEKDPKEKEVKPEESVPEESVPEIRVFGDESEPRGGHRCGSVHIPPITVCYRLKICLVDNELISAQVESAHRDILATNVHAMVQD